MQIEKYLNNLPEEVLINGTFCVTKKGDKKPFDPIKGYYISAVDPFYPIEEIVDAGVERYETLGLKAGNGLSIIDIDDCVSSSGVITDFAMDVINYMQSYTELSPSGKGIRILFATETPFDIKTHKTKNSKIGMEYYDAYDQENRGGRMCRLSGNQIMPFPFRKVDTQKLLDKYMVRMIEERESDLVDEEPNYDWCHVVYTLLINRLDLKSLMNREIDKLSESDADLILVNAIAEYTDNMNEIKTVFEMTRYYRTKGITSSKKRHKDKWDSEYGWNTVKMAKPSVVRLVKTEQSAETVDAMDVLRVAVAFNLLKPFYFRTYKIDWSIDYLQPYKVNDCLYQLSVMRKQKINLKEHYLKYFEEGKA